MKSFVFICIFLLAGLRPDQIAAKPFGEVILKKNHEFAFKPFFFKPISFIKEKIVHFGERHGIEKREVEEVVPDDNLRRVSLEKDMSRLPAEVFEFPEDRGPVVLITPPTPNKETMHTDIHREEHINNYLNSLEGIYSMYGAEKPVGLERPKPQEMPPTEGEDLIKKSSRWALYIGNAVVKILSKFLEGTKMGGKSDIDKFF